MKTDLLGVINLSGEEGFFKELTEHRNLAAVPFAGRYRLIDFTLTNMVQNEIANIGVFTLEKYRAMMDHLGSGKEWDLDRWNTMDSTSSHQPYRKMRMNSAVICRTSIYTVTSSYGVKKTMSSSLDQTSCRQSIIAMSSGNIKHRMQISRSSIRNVIYHVTIAVQSVSVNKTE